MASSAMLTTTATLTATSLVAVTETSKTPPLTTTTTTTTTAAASVGKPSVVTAGAATERPTATSASMLEHDDDDDDCKDDDILNTSLRCCANDPDFAVICAFLQKFAKELGLELPNFKRLQEWLTNTDEVADPIRDLHIKLLRKTRKTVHEKSWESAISKFCFTYSAQDGWELERFGYKQASLKVKLRLLRELLESQFERNNKFRNKILTLSADSLRSQPIGRDRLGHNYWLTQDDDCNLRIYQEHLDEEIWQVVATNRDEFVNLISRLRGNEVVLPSTDIGVIDEDTSSSNSCNGPIEKPPPPEEKDDSQEDDEAKVVPNLRLKLGEGGAYHHNVEKNVGKGEEELAAEEDKKLAQKKLHQQTSVVKKKITVVEEEEEEEAEVEGEEEDDIPGEEMEEEEEEEGEEAEEEDEEEVDSAEEDQSGDEIEENDSEAVVETEKKKSIYSTVTPAEETQKKVKPLLISQAKIASSVAVQHALPTNGCSKKRPLDDVDKTSPRPSDEHNSNTIKKFRPSLLDSKRDKKPSKYGKAKSDDEDDEDDDEDDEEDDEDVGSEEEDEADIEDEEGEEEDIDSAAAEEDENEEKDIEEDDEDDDVYDDNNIVGEVIEDPPIIVRGEGSGKQCDGANPEFLREFLQLDDGSIFLAQEEEEPEPIVGEAIEEEFLYIIGEGNGVECLVGNKNNEETTPSTPPASTLSTPTTQTDTSEPKATFFFGEPGCLKLSPIKKTASKEGEEMLQNSLPEASAANKKQQGEELLIAEKEEKIKKIKNSDKNEENNKDKSNEQEIVIEKENYENNDENALQEKSKETICEQINNENNDEQIQEISNDQKVEKVDANEINEINENRNVCDEKDRKENAKYNEQSKIEENNISKENETNPKEFNKSNEQLLDEPKETDISVATPELNGVSSSEQCNKNEEEKDLYEPPLLSDIERTEENSNDKTTLEETKETHENNGNHKELHEQAANEEAVQQNALKNENLVPKKEEEPMNKALVNEEVIQTAVEAEIVLEEKEAIPPTEFTPQTENLTKLSETVSQIHPETSTSTPTSTQTHVITQKCALPEKAEKGDRTTAAEAETATATVATAIVATATVATTEAATTEATTETAETIATAETAPTAIIETATTKARVAVKTRAVTETKEPIETTSAIVTTATSLTKILATSATVETLTTAKTPTIEAIETKEQIETIAKPSTTAAETTAPLQINRKRRLTDFAETQKPKMRPHTTSESEVELPEEPINLATHDDHEDDGSRIGGKRIKMRAKLTNTEIRKKVEAQKIAAVEETTSSSGEEEALRKRKIISPKQQLLNEKSSNFDLPQKLEKEHLQSQLAEIKEEVTVPTVVSAPPAPVVKQKPTLAEIIEKKLKKTPEKPVVKNEPCEGLNSISGEVTVVNASSISPQAPIRKSPITKPLKKNLLTQLRQEESDEEAIPRKRIIGKTALENVEQRQDSTQPASLALQTIEKLQKPEEPQKIEPLARATPDRATPDRQRKRRSSEDAQHSELTENAPKTDCLGEKLKKNDAHEVAATVKELSEEEVLPPPIKRLESTQEEISPSTTPSKIFSMKIPHKEEAVETKVSIIGDIKSEVKGEEVVVGNLSGRRSGRRGGTAVIYAELPQPKRTRGGSKAATVVVSPPKQEIVKPKVESVKTKPKEETLPDIKKPEDEPEIKKATEVQIESKEVKTIAQDKDIAPAIVKSPQSPPEVKPAKTPPKARGRKKREVDTTNIIEATDSETPVRQSRRIAQQKIREEAERRKLEEIALRTMKNELKKKKKAAAQADPTVPEPSEQSSSPDDTDVSEIEAETKKLKKKKCPGKDGTWSSGSEEQEEPEEEEEPPHYESDPGSPLFKSDHEFSPESDLEDESQVVPMKRARTARKEDAELSDAKHLDQEEEACQKCGKSDHPEWILLCDNCDKGYHCSCLSPVLFYIPEGDWYCPPCQQEQLIAALEKQLVEFDLVVKQKRLEEEEAQRLAEAEAERVEVERLEAEKRKKKKKKQRGDGESSDNDAEENGSAVGKSDKDSDDEDDDENAGEKSVKNKEKKAKKNQSNEKRKQRREVGGHRRRRRRAATRGARQRRRNASKSGGSGDSDDSDGSGSQSGTDSKSKSSGGSNSSSSATDSDDEPIYKLRKRRQINVSYRLNEYDDLINSALRKEMDEAAMAGNLGRGKDISTIIEADKEEQARQKQLEDGDGDEFIDAITNIAETDSKTSDNKIAEVADVTSAEATTKACEGEKKTQEIDSEEEPLKRKAKVKQTLKKKPRKLTTLDISSEEDNASDEDFKGSSLDEDDEDTSVSLSSNSDSSLEIYKRRGKKGNKKTRKAARRTARERRKVRKFVVDDSDEDEEEETRPKSKKKRKTDSDYTESEESGELSELSENMDSADLCDDTSSSEDSDGAWHPSKRKKQRKSNVANVARKSPKLKKPQTKKPKRVEYSDDDVSEEEEEDYEDEDDDLGMGGKGSGKQPRSVPLKTSNAGKGKGKGKGGAGAGKSSKVAAASKKKKKKLSDYDDDSFSDSEDSTRRTRGRRYAYLEDFEDDSSDGGIKPGVKRPDTPPEEREKFIKKQEEIKRMLAEKNAEGAKLAATPRLTPIKGGTRSPAKPGDSLSTVPLSVIRQAKVLDIDYLQRKGESVSDMDNVDDVDSEFDDADLPDDFPEDMDEDAIARMVEEEEEFGAAAASRELPAPDEVLKPVGTKVKAKEPEKVQVPSTANPSLAALSQMPSNAGSGSHSTGFTSGLQEPMRKRLPMPTMHPPLLRHQYPGSGQHHHSLPPHMMQRHAGPPTHLLQNALSAPLGQSIHRNFPQQSMVGAQRGPPGGPSMPPRHALPPHALPPSQQQLSASQPLPVSPGDSEAKPRGRRKKITPLRDPLQKQQAAAAATAAATGHPTTTTAGNASNKPETRPVTSVAPGVIKTATSLAIAQPPQLYKQPTGGSSNSSNSSSSSTQPSVITRMPHLPPHSAPPGRGMPLGPPGMYASGDVARFYGPPMQQASSQPGSRLPPTSSQRHRGPPHVGGMPPHHGMRPSYGPPPPLRGVIGSTNQTPPNSVSGTRPPYPPPPNHGDHHGAQAAGPYGPPPPARHAAPHINPYRPSIFGNPNYGPRGAPPGASMRTSGPPSQEYTAGPPRSYAPYGYYPPPPPLTAAHQPPPTSTHPAPSSSHAPVTSKSSAVTARTSTPNTSTPQPPAVPSSVIVSAPPSAIQLTPNNTSAALQKQAVPRVVIKTAPATVGPQSKSTPDVPATVSPSTSAIVEPRKKLITLETFATSKSPLALSGESSGSRSSPNVQPDGADDSTSAPAAAASGGNGQGASEFSGLVSYFSSQHDDYNT